MTGTREGEVVEDAQGEEEQNSLDEVVSTDKIDGTMSICACVLSMSCIRAA